MSLFILPKVINPEVIVLPDGPSFFSWHDRLMQSNIDSVNLRSEPKANLSDGKAKKPGRLKAILQLPPPPPEKGVHQRCYYGNGDSKLYSF